MPRRKAKETSDGFITRSLNAGPDRHFRVRLDNVFYVALKDMARREKVRIGEICALANVRKNSDVKLTRALRAFILEYFMEAATEEGHRKAGHGVRKPKIVSQPTGAHSGRGS